MGPLENVTRAWRLYQTDSRVDTFLAVVLVAVVAYPVVQLWIRYRKLGSD